jgi:hypothetical protein
MMVAVGMETGQHKNNKANYTNLSPYTQETKITSTSEVTQTMI